MALVRVCGWRSWGGWCVLPAALLAMAAYLLFEELDLVGSKLPSRLAGEAVAALEYTALDADRSFHLSVERLSNPSPSILTSHIPLTILSTSKRFATEISPTTLRAMLARAHVGWRAFPAPGSTADPF